MGHRRAMQGEEPGSRRAPFVLVEFAFGVAIMVVLTSLLLTHLAYKYTATREYRDQVFAHGAAKSILSELHALADRPEGGAFDIEHYDDGKGSNPTLSVLESGGTLVAPDDLSSRNVRRNGEWVWSRRIDVRPLDGVDDPQQRYVTVRILKRDPDGVEQPVARMSSIINSPAGGNLYWARQRPRW